VISFSSIDWSSVTLVSDLVGLCSSSFLSVKSQSLWCGCSSNHVAALAGSVLHHQARLPLTSSGPRHATWSRECRSRRKIQLVEVVAKLSKKMDAYDKHITSMGSDLSKVQSQVDLSMHSIQALQHEQIQLVQSMRPSGSTSTPRMTSGIIGSSPSSRTPSGAASPVPPLQHLHPEGSGIPKKTPSSAVNTGGFPHAGSESDN
jgi:hypothetical protein